MGIFTSRHDIAVLQSVLKGILEISLVFRPQGKQIIFRKKVISLKIFRKKNERKQNVNNTKLVDVIFMSRAIFRVKLRSMICLNMNKLEADAISEV